VHLYFLQLSRSDGKLIWVLVTVHGGKFQTTLDKHVTHLVAAEASGVSSTSCLMLMCVYVLALICVQVYVYVIERFHL